MHQNINDFIAAVRRVTAPLRNTRQYTESMDWHPCEYGWAGNLNDRMDNHHKWKATNAIMQLFRAVCIIKFPTWDVEMEQFVLYEVAEPSLAAPAEAFITEVGNGYVESGFGFSHHPAGMNNPAELIPIGSWSLWQKELRQNGIWKLRLRELIAERAERIELCRRIEWLTAEMDRLNSPAEDQTLKLELVTRLTEVEMVNNWLKKYDDINRRYHEEMEKSAKGEQEV